ncbi:chemotaxis protein CheB [Aurantimonas sp. 22II-16-19i]|uniref:chemotaxis protein CheB n=1 Tax=Aurantimonas sp. 22II-16-19i TaxID=1317114 RepID=UPI0009F7F2DD|nr:chemotaxis protein CheB [Aurantimonas sp. 22II-16-19i]ORE90580.1 MCP methyltransferase/methylesterase, CheR/CheB with PAS/PAC sensor [Aurantimonas sp. 22II-16-19i]
MADVDTSPPGRADQLTPVCAIGASAGGVAALRSLFRQLPTDLGLAYVVILHLAPDQPSAMSEILSICTTMPVHQVEDGPALRPDCVYVIPPDRELAIEGDNVTARPFSVPRGRRAPIDMFFRSIAAARGDGMAVILTGAGSDGTTGVRAIKEAGGVVFVQEPAEAEFPSMPHNAIATGVADFVAPIARLVERIGEVARSKEAVRSLNLDGAANDLRRVVGHLRAHTGHDFGSYKRATVLRRVLRRMHVCRVDSLDAYAAHLRETPEEAQQLFADLLISVTRFFRDPPAFEVLRQQAMARLFEDVPEDGLRVWSVGCATGEEAFSIAILLMEEAARRRLHVPIQIVATDLDEGALATAREGRYPRSIEADVHEERLKRFFIDEGTHYRVHREVRDTVLFASHSVLKDPPFMRLDLIVCRNLLIYLERSLQQQLCSLFHFGLKSGRYLFLGSAETVDAATDMFTPVDREARLYRSRPRAAHRLPLLPQLPSQPGSFRSRAEEPSQRDRREDASSASHLAALEQAAPPSVIVDEGHNIVHLSPTAGRFIQHSAGPFNARLSAVARPELRLDLKLALDRAFDLKLPSLTHPVTVSFDGEGRRVSMHVTPVAAEGQPAAQAMVFFLDGGPAEEPDSGSEAVPAETRRLQADLKSAREALVASRNEQEVSIQDLRAANEELQSINEEYRSTAEELETSKEELQSMNEELQTVNAELKGKLESISAAHSDLKNLTAATEIGTLFLDAKLRIRMFTPPVVDLFNITESDIGRAITDFTHRLTYENIEADVERVLRDLTPVESEIGSTDGRWYMMRLRPYRTIEDRISGTVLTFVEITDWVEAEMGLRDSERSFRALVQASSQVLYRMSPGWEQMRQLTGGGFLSDTHDADARWQENYILPEDRPRVQSVIDEAIREKKPFDLEHRVRRVDGTIGWTQSRAVPMLGKDGAIEEWFGAASDVTAGKEAAEALRGSEERLRLALEVGGLGTWDSNLETGETTWSDNQYRVLGYAVGEVQPGDEAWLRRVHPEDREELERALEASREERHVFEHEYRVIHPDGSTRWCFARGRFHYGVDGQPVRMIGVVEETTERREWAERQRVMVAELQHRTRNLLALVRSIVGQTIKGSGTLEMFRDKLNDRLAALSRVQGLLSRSGEEPITIRSLVTAELDALGAAELQKRVTVDGPRISLRNTAVQTLALGLHELATNARKYGALSNDDGHLAIRWHEDSVEDAPHVVIDWTETGRKPAPPDEGRPVQKGYGQELIEKALPYALGARTTYELTDDGVRCTIALPLSGRRRIDREEAGDEP